MQILQEDKNSNVILPDIKPSRPPPNIYEAAFYGDIRQLEDALLIEQKATAENEIGLNAFHIASANGHTVFLRALISRGFDVNSKDKNGQTGLHHAARNGHLDTMKFLVAEGADHKILSTKGRSPLDVAYSNTDRQGQRAIVSFLKTLDREKMAWEKD